MSLESTAGSILKRAIEYDGQKRFTEALVCYQEGLQILVDNIKDESDPQKKTYLRSKIEEFMKRAEQIKKVVQEKKDEGIFHEQVHIEAGSVGHSYQTLFGRFLDDEVTAIKVEDPYIRSFHQCQNFLRLCELVAKRCTKLALIKLITSHETSIDSKNVPVDERLGWFNSLTIDLKKRNIKLIVEFSTTLHDRQISLNSGWIIKIGRGLDFFKPPENKFTLGMYDLDLRPCHETTVDIFHSKDVKHIFS